MARGTKQLNQRIGVDAAGVVDAAGTILSSTVRRTRLAHKWPCFGVAVLCVCATVVSAQIQTDEQHPSESNITKGQSSKSESDVLLGPGDSIRIWALEVEEISNREYTVDDSGELTIPMLGRVHAAGLTVRQFEDSLLKGLRKYVRSPEVVVSVQDFRSRAVSVLGAVNQPGPKQLRSAATLVEVITMSGGLRADAGRWVRIVRQAGQGLISHPNAVAEPTGGSSVEVDVKALMASENSQDNIQIAARDVITVTLTDVVYVLGAVAHQGSLPCSDSSGISVLQAVSLAGGLGPFAAAHRSRILRPIMGGPRRAELPVDVNAMLGGKAKDVPLLPHDVLVIPDSTGKKVAKRTIEAALATGTSILTLGVVQRH